MLELCAHPLLDVAAFTCVFPAPLGALPSPDWLQALLRLDAPAPLKSDDAVRGHVRDLLRQSGFKPTGRSKPASEYLVRAAGDGALRSINAAVDVCNVVSLHSGLPISVVDLELAQPPFRVAPAPEGEQYVFNAGGQTIDVGALLCLFDAQGPCANPVKDAQRTKTREATTRTLSVLWGTRALSGRAQAALAWYRELLLRLGAQVTPLAG